MSLEKEIKSDVHKPKAILGIRHVQTMMLFLAMVLAYGMRVNMSMAIVAMTNKNDENAFDWSMQMQSVILSSFFWGYVILQIPGGEMATRFGGKILITVSIAVNSVVSLVLPIAAHYGGWQAVCACRVLQGLAQGFVYPSIHSLIGKWVPLEEKSRLGTIIYAGGQLGTALQLMASGFIAQAWGWPAIFYVNGSLGAIWTAIYVFIGSASPAESKMIGAEEKLYIQTSLGQVGTPKKFKTPWTTIFTSLPFISLIFVHCCQAWGFWTLMTEMPSYLNQVLGVDIKSNGVMSALPYLAMYLLSFPFGFLSDYVLKKDYLSITTTRKLNNSIGLFGPAIALIGLSYSPAGNVTVAVTLLTIVVGLNAGHITGFMLVHIDMAPNFAGTLMGITNCIGNIVSIIAPLAAGAILKDETDPNEWRKVFYIASAIYIIGNLFFIICGTSERQKWNDDVNNISGDCIESTSESKLEKVKFKTPWTTIFTSLPFISLIFVHCCQAWGFWTLMTEMPSYLNQVLGVDIKSNGVMSALPYLAMYLLSFPFGFLSDYVLKKDYLSITTTRKLNNCIGSFGPAIALIGLSYSPAGNVTVAVTLLTIVVGLNAGHITGFMLVHIDMAPNFAGTLMGITNCIGNIVSIIAPLAAGAILKDETDPNEWRKVFYIASAIYIIGNLFFIICGTSERQKWNDDVNNISGDCIESTSESKLEKVV